MALEEFDIVNFSGKRKALEPFYWLVRGISGRKLGDKSTPVHTGMAVRDPKDGKVKILDMNPNIGNDVKLKNLEDVKKKYNVSSVSRLKFNDRERARMRNEIQGDLNNPKRKKYAVSGLFGQYMFGIKPKKNREVCSQYVSNVISKNTRYKATLGSGYTKPSDLTSTAGISLKGNPYIKPDMKVVKNLGDRIAAADVRKKKIKVVEK
jgi:hypothetical protein